MQETSAMSQLEALETEMGIWLHDRHGSLDEATKYLRSLNRLNGDMLNFIGKHNLRSEIE